MKGTDVISKMEVISEGSSPLWLGDRVKYVRILWCDISGQRRCRMVPASQFKAKDISTVGVGLSSALLGMPSLADSPAPNCCQTATGEFRLVPDESTGRVLPRAGHALVLGDMHEKLGVPWEYCPRSTLRRLEKRLRTEFDLELRAGFEMEFYLLRQLGSLLEYEVADCSPYCSSAGLNKSLDVIETMLSWMDSLEVVVDQFHCAGGKGQFECALAYDTVSQSADKLFLAREGMTAAAMSHQLIASFLPKPPVESVTFGSSNCLHLSIWSEGRNVLGAGPSSGPNYGLSDLGKSFIAGVLHHLPALLAIISSHPNSYERIQPNNWSEAYQCWGRQNQEAPLRTVVDMQTGVISNFELKSFDGCTNPHLGLAAVLASGLDGLQKGMPLPDPVDVNPYKVQRLPGELKDAVDHLRKDDVLKDLLGHGLMKSILAVREAEVEYFSKNPIKCTFPLEPYLAPLLQIY